MWARPPAWVLCAVIGAVVTLPTLAVATGPVLITAEGPVEQCSAEIPLSVDICIGSGHCFGYCASAEYFVGDSFHPPLDAGELVPGKQVRVSSTRSSLLGPGDVLAITIDGRSHSVLAFPVLQMIQRYRANLGLASMIGVALLLASLVLFLRQHGRPIRPALSFAGGVVATGAIVALLVFPSLTSSARLGWTVGGPALLGFAVAIIAALTSFPRQGQFRRRVAASLGACIVPPVLLVVLIGGAYWSATRWQGFRWDVAGFGIWWLTLVVANLVAIGLIYRPIAFKVGRASTVVGLQPGVSPGAIAGLALIGALGVQIAIAIILG